MINRSLDDCEKSSNSIKFIPSRVNTHSITPDVVSPRLPDKKYFTTLRYITWKYILNSTDNACNSCL